MEVTLECADTGRRRVAVLHEAATLADLKQAASDALFDGSSSRDIALHLHGGDDLDRWASDPLHNLPLQRGSVVVARCQAPATPDAPQPIHTPKVFAADEPASSCAVSQCGTWLFTGHTSGTLRCWAVSTHSEAAPLLGHRDLVSDLAVSPCGRRLCSASWDGTVRCWDLATRRQVAALRHPQHPRYTGLLVSNRGYIYTTTSAGYAVVWEADTSQATDHASLSCLTEQAATGRVFSTDSQGALREWSVGMSSTVRTVQLGGGADGVPCALLAMPACLLVASRCGDVSLIDYASLSCTRTARLHSGRVVSLKGVPNRRLVVSVGADRCVCLANSDTLAPVGTERSWAACFATPTPCGSQLCIGTWDSVCLTHVSDIISACNVFDGCVVA